MYKVLDCLDVRYIKAFEQTKASAHHADLTNADRPQVLIESVSVALLQQDAQFCSRQLQIRCM